MAGPQPLDARFTTDVAMRRLTECLAAMGRETGRTDIGTAGDPLAAFIAGIQFGLDYHVAVGQPDVVRVYQALADLAAAVREDTIRSP